jgi:two-component system response regulator (stage 0 sporulation protein F)
VKDHIPKILIVDGDEGLCALLSVLMKREGYRVLQAGSGEAALDLLKTEVPDVMLLDIRMPDMDGI